MSSDEGCGTDKQTQDSKRRRIQRACDVCRRKKIRCDGVQMPGNQCTNCIDCGLACTYIEAAKKRGPPKSYIEKLENRVQKLQDLIAKISPEALEHLDKFPDAPPLSSHPPIASKEPDPTFKLPLHDQARRRFIHHLGSDTAPRSAPEEDDADVFLIDQLEKLNIDTRAHRFFGKSSGLTLIRAALELKREYLESGGVREPESEDDFSDVRKEWPHLPTTPPPPPPQYTYPPPDLLTSLIDLYFMHMNTYLPLLHRPTFERAVAQGLHLKDPSFAITLLLVCAVAGRFSDDPRVMDDPDAEGRRNAHSCGWKWFVQVPFSKPAPLAPPNLYDVQFYALLGQFLQASSVPQACWMIVGAGIRAAQDVGAHRRKTHGVHTVEDELWKRVFWVLICMDRLFSSSLGRPCAIHDEDFDLDMPIECDDEYWEHSDPQLRWRQPMPHKTPSVITYFNIYIRLNQILAFLLRTVYAINKSKILLGFVGQEWEETIVSELDSALNAWLERLPDHLRWDPTRANDVFFNQSASLYCAYYHIQILVHRPFIPSPRQPNATLSFPSLAICTNAARACSHILDAQRKRFKVAPPPLQTTAFSAGVVLLLSIWGGKRSGLLTDFDKEMANVQKCMDVLNASETRWYLAGRLRDVLCELASVGDLPLPQPSSSSPTTTTAQKREREPEQDETTTPAAVSTSHREPAVPPSRVVPDVMDATRNIVGRSGSGRRQGLAPSGNGSSSGSSVLTEPSPFAQQTLFTFPAYDFDSSPDLVYQQDQHHQHPPPPQQQQHPLHGIVNPQPDWYGAPNTGSGSSRAQVRAQAQAPAIDHLQPNSHSQMHIHPTTSIPGSSSSYGSAYYGPSTADLGVMSPFAPPGGEAGVWAGSGHEHAYGPYRMAHGIEADGGLGMSGSSGMRTSTSGAAGGVGGGLDASGSGTAGIGMGMGMGVDDAFAMWSAAPAGFELSEWGDYLSSINDPSSTDHGHMHGHGLGNFHGSGGG